MIDLYELVNKLTGSTDSVGESNRDEDILDNIIRKHELAESLVDDLISANQTKDRVEYSMKRNGKAAEKYLFLLRDQIIQEIGTA